MCTSLNVLYKPPMLSNHYSGTILGTAIKIKHVIKYDKMFAVT